MKLHVKMLLFLTVFIIVQSLAHLVVFADKPILTLSATVSEEPLLGGNISYRLTVKNVGATPLTDKGYNLTITNTLPAELSFNAANPSPTFIQIDDDGATALIWDNLADLEVNETIVIDIQANIRADVAIGQQVSTGFTAAVNRYPDNSGHWVTQTVQLSTGPQAIDIEVKPLPSTANQQASGAGEYDTVTDWSYHYQVTVKNNNVGSSQDVAAQVTLPPGVAYLGEVSINPNPNNTTLSPTLKLNNDGSLSLNWHLDTLTTVQYHTPIIIKFAAAIPYRYRTKLDTDAADGPFAGPMRGDIIPEDASQSLTYQATARYEKQPTADGTTATPNDDQPALISAEYLTISKNASPGTVGIGDTVNFSLNYYVSEYYTVSNVLLTDILPDGMTYTPNSASLNPESVQVDTPGPGQTTLVWRVTPMGQSLPAGSKGRITFQATVDETYTASPYTGQPVVSADSLTNQLNLTNNWADIISPYRQGTGIPDRSTATIHTRTPSFSKAVWNTETGQWTDFNQGFTGDTMRFKLVYDAAPDVHAKGIIIRDFLPRGMIYVANSAVYTVSGLYNNDSNCDTAPQQATIGSLNGLQYLHWPLCNTWQGSHWEATIDAVVQDIPNVQPGWLVANFGKLSGHNTPGETYSLRDIAKTDYIAPEILLTKSGNPYRNLEANDEVIFTVGAYNQGEATAYNLILTDTIPSDLILATGDDYTVISGDPLNGNGGVIRWETIAQLDAGQTHNYVYTSTVAANIPAGKSITNLASVSYNSRTDNTGHQTSATDNPDDLNTVEETVQTKGVTVKKTVQRIDQPGQAYTPNGQRTNQADEDSATIGDVMRWTITAEVPPGFVAYHPIIEEYSLPNGFDYITDSVKIYNATPDTINHPTQPQDNGNDRLYWFLQTITNTSLTESYIFSITLDTLVTGVNGNNINTAYYPQNCCIESDLNRVYVRWYPTYSGTGSNYGEARTGGYRSRPAYKRVYIRQPHPTISKIGQPITAGAGDLITYTLTIFGGGNDIGFDLTVEDKLSPGIIFVETISQTVKNLYNIPAPVLGDYSVSGSQLFSYTLDALYVGSTWQITYTARISDDISADLALINTAKLSRFSSQPGNAPDSNGDGLPDERIYEGNQSDLTTYTPTSNLHKAQQILPELTFGSQLVYTLTLPAEPINATMYNTVLTDVIDSRFNVVDSGTAVVSGTTLVWNFGNLTPYQQKVVTMTVQVPTDSIGQDGDLIANQGQYSHRYHNQTSNRVEQGLFAPALVVNKQAEQTLVAMGDIITFTLSVNNVGGGLANKVVITDTLTTNMSYQTGSSQLNGQPFKDPINSAWQLAQTIPGYGQVQLSFRVEISPTAKGEVYTNTVSASGVDSRGQPIPANNSLRVPADTDLDDQDNALLFANLNWFTETLFVAYEDLKNVGWSDWDYNDLVVGMTIKLGLTKADNVAALSLTYNALARGASYDHDFIHNMPLIGGGTAYLTVFNKGKVVTQTVQKFGDNPDFTIFNRTKEALPPLENYFNTNTSPNQPWVEGYTASLTIYLDQPTRNRHDIFPPLPWDPYIIVHDTGETVHLVMPGHLDNMQEVNKLNEHNLGSPLLGYDLPLAHRFEPGWAWMVEYYGLWWGYPNYVAHITSGRSMQLDWYIAEHATADYLWQPGSGPTTRIALDTAPPAQRYFAGPAVADLDGNGETEIIYGTILNNRVEVRDSNGNLQPGWPQNVGGGIRATAATANLDGDTDLEIVVGAENGLLYAWHHTGTLVSGYPITVTHNYRLLATPAITNLMGDAAPEIVIPAANGWLYAYHANGSPVSGYPVNIGNVADKFNGQMVNSSPQLVDLDANGSSEIVIGSTNGYLYAFNANGSLRWAYPTGDMIFSTPAVVDVDPAHNGPEIIFGSGDSYVYLLSRDGELLWRNRTGWTVRSSPTIADLDEDGDLEILVGSDDDHLWAWHHTGAPFWANPPATNADIFSSPTVADLDGDGKPEIIVGSDDAHIYAWDSNGQPVSGFPVTTTVSVKAAPAVIDLDGDGNVEIVVGDLNGQQYILDKTGQQLYQPTIYLPIVFK